MTLPAFLFYLAAGRLLVWLLQVNGLMQPIWKWQPILMELGECDLCLGFWVYLALALISEQPFGWWPWPIEVVMLAALSTTLAHLIRLGWQAKFATVVIE